MDDIALSEQLFARAGMMMEDASVLALMSGAEERASRLLDLRSSVRTVAALIAAAEALSPSIDAQA